MVGRRAAAHEVTEDGRANIDPTQPLLDEAQQGGYSEVLLDTLDDMEAARGLYASLGFEEIPPYYFNPIPGAHYLKATLGVTTSQY